MTDTTQRQIPVGRRLLDVLKVAYSARLPVLLEGESGIGKSEIFQQLGRELGIEVIVIDLTVFDPPDLVGIPLVVNGRIGQILNCSTNSGEAGRTTLGKVLHRLLERHRYESKSTKHILSLIDLGRKRLLAR